MHPFELSKLCLTAAIVGAIVAAAIGYTNFGIWGAAAGVPAGFVLGFLAPPMMGYLILSIFELFEAVLRGVKKVLRLGIGGQGPPQDSE